MAVQPPDDLSQNYDTGKEPSTGIKGFFQSPFLKFLLIGFLILMLLIPMGMVQGVIGERQQYQSNATREISQSWGGNQVLVGPILSVPYYVESTVDKKKVRQRFFMHFLPQNLDVQGKIVPETRARGIFKSVVYNSQLQVKGSISMAGQDYGGVDPKSLDWGKAKLSYGISDIRGIQEISPITLGGKTATFQPVAMVQGVYNSGMHVPVNLSQRDKSLPFSFRLNLRGSEAIQFVPVGADTHIALASEWQHPSFIGKFLPSERKVSDQGFSADWKVSRFARNFPQVWTDENPQLQAVANHGYETTTTAGTGTSYSPYASNESAWSDRAPSLASGSENVLGVSLLQPVNNYRESMRSAKYSILFLALTFLTFFLCEVMLRTRIHAIQYILVGLALCLFYLLLVSMSEFLAFGSAYLIASAATITLITGYTAAIVQARRLALTGAMAGLLSLLYAYLYVLLQLEDMSLLFGSIGLFLILAAVMYITRNVDWYNGKKITAARS